MSIKTIAHNGVDRIKNTAVETPKKIWHVPGNSVRFTNRVAKRTFFGAGERMPFLTKIPLVKHLFAPKVQTNNKLAPNAIEPLSKKEILMAMAATSLFMSTIAVGVYGASKNWYEGLTDRVNQFPIFTSK